MIVNAVWKREDHGLVFGAATVFAALTSAAAFISVFLRAHVEDQAGRMFVLLAGLSGILLVLAAYDWGRRKLLAAAVIAATALSVFIVRTGFESLKVPPQWERAQIAAQAKANESVLQPQYQSNVSSLKETATDARADLDNIVNGSPQPNVDPALLVQAKKIINKAYLVIQHGEAGNAADFSQFDTLVGDEGPQYPAAATSRLADAVHALQAAESAAAAPPASTSALKQAVCVIDPPPSDRCPAGRALAITTNHQWVAAQYELNVQLAEYRAQVTGTQADQTTLQSVLAQLPDADENISILSAAENGPETLWRSALHASGPALVPGPLGWLLFGALLLWLLSWLLKVNAAQQAGPVSVTPAGSGSDNDKLNATLRVAVLQNVAEPGAAPGASSTNPVTTLLGIAGGSVSGLSQIVQAVQAVAGQRYGYQVAIDVTAGDVAGSGLETGGASTAMANSTGVTTVLVRVISLTSGSTYASHLCESQDTTNAVRTAGLWAAGYILNRSSRIPQWAAWQAETAHALVSAKDSTKHTVSALKAALADAPNSGILLVLLGHRYELAGQPLDAIECYARAVAAYPRYGVARYRLAVALAAMRHDDFPWRRSPDQAGREDDMLRAVQLAIGKLGVNDGRAIAQMLVEEATPAQAPPTRSHRGQEIREGGRVPAEKVSDRERFRQLAVALLRALECDTTRRYLLVDALRRAERKSVWPALVPLSKHPAARFPDLVRSARQALCGESEALDKAMRKDSSWWQISYNAACCCANLIKADSRQSPGQSARLAEPDTDPEVLRKAKEKEKAENQKAAEQALNFLDQTLVRPGVEQLSAEWVSHDPDLSLLRSLPRFQRFLTQLRPGE